MASREGGGKKKGVHVFVLCLTSAVTTPISPLVVPAPLAIFSLFGEFAFMLMTAEVEKTRRVERKGRLSTERREGRRGGVKSECNAANVNCEQNDRCV